MSLIVDPTLMNLWREAQAKADKEYASVALWNHLYSKYIFPEKEWVISPEAPPEQQSRRRVDLVIKYTAESGGLRVLIFHEQKPWDASIPEIDTSERQAYDACVRHLGDTQDIDIIYAVTSYGTKARAWTYHRDDDNVYLDPLFGTDSLGDKDQYVELHSTEATEKLFAAFQYMRRFPPTKIKGVEYTETGASA